MIDLNDEEQVKASQPSLDLAALSELLEKVNAVVQRLGPESITDALRQYPHAHPKNREVEFAYDLSVLLAAARRVPELETEVARLRKGQRGFEMDAIFANLDAQTARAEQLEEELARALTEKQILMTQADGLVKNAEREESRADSLQAQLDEAQVRIAVLEATQGLVRCSTCGLTHSTAGDVIAATKRAEAAEARANAAEERVKGLDREAVARAIVNNDRNWNCWPGRVKNAYYIAADRVLALLPPAGEK